MSSQTKTSIPPELHQFLQHKDEEYRHHLNQLDLFDPHKTKEWDKTQKAKFAAVFYHTRGHFINFMWYIANFAEDEAIKAVVMENIHEEIGIGNKFSHEKLYERFAQECGVNIHEEIIDETHYVSFARAFNQQHLAWLAKHSTKAQFAAFSAYERLDNIDYPFLTSLAESIGISPSGLTFFRVHMFVEHFDSTLDKLLPIWQDSPETLQQAVAFIYDHQHTMWRKFSDYICLKHYEN